MHVIAEKKLRSLDIKLLMLKHEDTSFDGAIAAVNKKLFATRVECASLRWN